MTAERPSALITGASRGIGLGVARHLAALGWSLTLCARGADQLDQVRQELESLGATVHVAAGDLADETIAQAAVDGHREVFSDLNAMVLAAGVGSAGPVDGYPLRRFDKQFAVNVRAPFALVARALPLLRAGAVRLPGAGGRIVAITSMEGVHPEAGLAAYGASKAALIALVRSINIEENANGVVASAISPGFVDTDMSAWTTDTIPAEQMLTVADIVKVVDLVLSVSAQAVLPHIIINRAAGGAYRA
ncbi:SDR family oxidoreductase [soil metagenome]